MKKNLEDYSISVVGGGLMGCGIAQLFAYAGHRVTVSDVSNEVLSSVHYKIRHNLERMAAQELAEKNKIESTLEKISINSDLNSSVIGAHFVVEAVSENLELKQKIFQQLDSVCPQDTILASNTSVISITEIAQKSLHQERIVGTHFWNPPTLIPLVEVIPGHRTSIDVVDVTFDLLAHVGKHPVRVKQDVPGFVGNRLQHALWREAISIIEHGIAGPDEVDEVVKFGFGARLAILGPLENAELVGLDLTYAIHDYILKHLENSPNPSPLLIEKVEKQELGFKSGQGFRSWSPERAQQVRTNLEDYLFKWVKSLTI